MQVRPNNHHFRHREDFLMKRASAVLAHRPEAVPFRLSTSRVCSRRGFTLIEMMVAVALSLLIMLAVVTVFGELSAGVRDARAMAELADRLRIAQDKLVEDLRNATALQGKPTPPLPENRGDGFFEYIEGPSPRALTGSGAQTVNSQTGVFDPTVGDVDDVLCFTIRSDELLQTSVPLQGGGRRTVYSHYAEVCWFLDRNRLVRKMRLIVPGANLTGVIFPAALTEVVPLEMSQLALRHNRLLHVPQQNNMPNWPNFFISNDPSWVAQLNNQWDQWLGNGLQRPAPGHPLVLAQLADIQQHVVLDNVLSFDVKVWDPQAPVFLVANTQPNSPPVAVTPSSLAPGSNPAVSRYAEELQRWFQAGRPATWQNRPVVPGTFVDLFYARPLYTGGNQQAVFHLSWFSGPGYGTLGQGAATGMPAVYDTWTTLYERDGWDQDGDGLVDEGSNESNDANNAPPFPGPSVDPHLVNVPEADEPAEQEAPPPYPHPIRALQIKIRVFEPDTQQVREVTVIQAF